MIAYIAIDWGTSSFRLWACDESGHSVTHFHSNEGMQYAVNQGFAAILDKYLQQLDCHKNCPIIICGMAGAKQGWSETPYIKLPTTLNDLTTHAIRFQHHQHPVVILPGLAQDDVDKPDVMRGEETIISGYINTQDDNNDFLLCLPGTHSKWVTYRDQSITHFHSFMTGELFNLLKEYSILRFDMTENNNDDLIFITQIKKIIESPAQFSQYLFQARAGILLGYQKQEHCFSYISATVIGLEIAAMLQQCQQTKKIILLGNGHLLSLYQKALSSINITYDTNDSYHCVQAGLHHAYKIIASS